MGEIENKNKERKELCEAFLAAYDFAERRHEGLFTIKKFKNEWGVSFGPDPELSIYYMPDLPNAVMHAHAESLA